MKIEFVPMIKEHLELWRKWIEIPHVKNTWFIEGYEPAEYMERKINGNGYDYPFIFLIDNKPLGFIQACDLYAYRTTCPKPKGVFCYEDEGTFCFDLFIADENYLGKGYGTKVVKAFVQKLLDEFEAKKILIDPAADNKRAIRCYEKAGFEKIGTAHDGVCAVSIMEWKGKRIRESIRVILINDKNQILLMKADDPSTTTTEGKYNGPFWFLIGGELEPQEDVNDGVLREIFEETGISKEHISLGPIVWRGEFDLVLAGQLCHLRQHFMVAKTDSDVISMSNFTPEEKQVIKNIRWFTLEEIRASKELIYPLCLKDHLPEILAGKYPKQPIELDLGENP